MELAIIIVYATIHALTPLLIAGVGELVVEKSGVLNLGIEGMMLVGCVSGFITGIVTGNLLLAFVVATLAGMLMSGLFGILAIVFRVNQVASGLALTIFGIGLSAFIGLDYVGEPLQGLKNLYIPLLSDLPVLGKLIFSHDLIVYFAFGSLVAVQYFLYNSRAGLILRAVGENHNAAFSMGYDVITVRLLAVLFGGAMAGIAGGYLSLVYTPLWTEGMTAGRGWIVLALVVFSSWRPYRLLFGAFLFGLVSIAQLFLQGNDGLLNQLPTEFFTILPYLTTIVVLVMISSRKTMGALRAPANLGQAFEPR